MSKNVEVIENWKDIDNIRNISIISHVDHGKTTLSDHFIASGGILPKHLAGQLRALDDLPEEQKRGITIESSYTALIIQHHDVGYLINLIDTPGHVDFSGKVAESLRLVDGALLLVDAVEGIMAQTKTVLRQAIKEQVRLILFINKIDRLIMELQLTEEKIQERIQRIIGEVHGFYAKFNVPKQYYPSFSNGSVILGSALDGWAIDFKFVHDGGKISSIISMYNESDAASLSDKVPVMKTLIANIVSNLPAPIAAQKTKFPLLFETQPDKSILSTIHTANPLGKLIFLVGRSHRLQNSGQLSYIIRLLSGTIQRGIIVKTSESDQKIRITRLFQIVGRSIKDVKKVKSGAIAGVILSKPVIPGAILSSIDQSLPKMTDVSYVQDPVVAVSIEPLEIKQIGKLEHAIETICEVTPGLVYEVNHDTGELLAMGVGTLQLEILKSDLESQEFNLEISEPKILKFEMPTQDENFQSVENYKYSGFAGITENLQEVIVPSYTDNRNNVLIFHQDIGKEVEEGFIEVFRQCMRVSPTSGQHVKNLSIVIHKLQLLKKEQTYENGMIMGSSIIKTAFVASQTKIHAPYYSLEISTPEEYLGPMLQELQRLEILVDDVRSEKKEALILGQIAVETSSKLADQLRQITDGNVFWSFSNVVFKPV